jgi:hypothetical protein
MKAKVDAVLQKLRPAFAAIKPSVETLIAKIPPDWKKYMSLQPAQPEAGAPVAVLACDLGSTKIILLEVERSPEGITVNRFARLERPKDAAQIGVALRKALDEGGFQTQRVRFRPLPPDEARGPACGPPV